MSDAFDDADDGSGDQEPNDESEDVFGHVAKVAAGIVLGNVFAHSAKSVRITGG